MFRSKRKSDCVLIDQYTNIKTFVMRVKIGMFKGRDWRPKIKKL